MRRIYGRELPMLFAPILLILCAWAAVPADAVAAGAKEAVAVLHPTEGNSVKGEVRFTETQNGVKVVADVRGLEQGKHGFHVHEYGDCTASDATSAGGHFNPLNKPHAGPEAEERHMGDLGNIAAGEDGNASYERVDSHLKLGGENGIVGRAVIVHAKEDDFATQPTGAAGARLACGVIGVAKPEGKKAEQ